MAEEYETFLHRWFEEVRHKGREEAIDEMFAENGKIIEAWNEFNFMTMYRQLDAPALNPK